MIDRRAKTLGAIARWAPYALCAIVWRLANRALWDPTPSAFFNEGPWLAAIAIALVCVRLVSVEDARRANVVDDRRAPAWSVAIVFAAIAIVIAYWHVALVRDVRSAPIASSVADMLPLMQAGFRDLDAHVSPYRPHDVPWRLTNYYLPSTFLPYYAASKLGIDIRWVNVGALDGVLAALACLVPWRGAPRVLVRTFVAWLVVVTLFGSFVVGRNHFAAFVQLGPYWMYVAVAFVALVLRRPIVSACALGLVLAAREPGVFLVAFALAHLGYVAQRRWRPSLVAIGIAVALFAPFVLADPLFFRGNLAQYSSFDVPDSITRHVGLAGVLHAIGAPYLRWPLLAAAIAWIALRARGHLDDALFMTKAAGAVGVLFAICAPITWEYTFVEGLVVLGVYCIARERIMGRAAPARAGSA